MKIWSVRARAFVVGGLAVALLGGVMPTGASARTNASLDRLAGPDRYATAIAISRHKWPNQAGAVVLARADKFPDALAGAPFAASKYAPLLLTPPTSLSATVSTEIKRALPAGGTVYLLGGTAALSDAVARSVSNLGYKAVRLGGADRYATAVTIAKQNEGPNEIFVATGLSYPAALLAGATAGSRRGVVVLTADTKMPAVTKAYLDDQLTQRNIGRTAVGPEAVAADPSASPVTGRDKYELSFSMASRYFSSYPVVVGIASGEDFADALSGGAHIGVSGGPLLLSRPGALDSYARTYLESVSPHAAGVYLYGGPKALSVDVEDETRNLVRGATYFRDGTFRVGEDIPAGTYRLRRDPEVCYWERLSGFTGTPDDIKANGLTDHHTVVTIGSSDAGFKSDGCGMWTSDLSPVTQSLTAPFTNGTWIVGTDISAGTWTAPGGESCYWERLSSFSGDVEAVISNDVGPTQPVVTIASGDAGFSASDCGQWQKVD